MRTFIAFWFGLVAETFARVTLWIQSAMNVDFNCLRNGEVKVTKKVFK